MQSSQKAINLIKQFESLQLKAYYCPAGLPTIGFGHTGGLSKTDVSNGKTITVEQADALLAEDIRLFEALVNDAVRVPLTQGQFDALVCFAFNCKGWQNSSLIRLVNDQRFDAAAEQFDRWVYGGGKKLNGLIKRRSLEKQLFLSA